MFQPRFGDDEGSTPYHSNCEEQHFSTEAARMWHVAQGITFRRAVPAEEHQEKESVAGNAQSGYSPCRTMPDKRKHVRVARREAVRIESDGQSVVGTAVDISAMGIRVSTDPHIRFAPEGRLSLSFPDLEQGVSIPVRLAHDDSRDGALGLQFVFDSLAQMELVDRYVRSAKEHEIRSRGPAANNRRLPRASCTIRSVKAHNHSADIVGLDNASTDGFLASYTGVLSAGDAIALEFWLPGDVRPLAADVTVVYTEQNPFHHRATAGLRVTRISEVDRARLRNFIVQSSAVGSSRTVHSWIAEQGLDCSYQISDPAEIVRLFALAQSMTVVVHLVPGREGGGRIGYIVGVDAEARTVSFGASEGRPISSDEVELFVSFLADGASYYCSVGIVDTTVDIVRCDLPGRLQRSEQRSYGRTEPAENAEIVLVLGGDDPREIPARLVDISRRGFLCEVPSGGNVAQAFSRLRTIGYRCAETLGLDTEGEIRHVRIDSDAVGGPVVRLGIEAGLRRREVTRRVFDQEEWLKIPVHTRPVSFLSLAGARSTVVRFSDEAGREMVGLVNSVGVSAASQSATVFLLPPAFGKKKEALAPLAAVILANFAALGEPAVVIRYDGINRPGESYAENPDAERGYEMLHYRISEGRSDLEAALRYVKSRSDLQAKQVVLVTFSMSALDGRKLLGDPRYSPAIDFWISAMGVPSGQSALRNTLGGLDVVGNYRVGIPNGICGLLGHLVDMDQLAQDLIEHRYAYVTDAREEMARISAPVLWVYGSHDMWVTTDEIEDVMSVQSPGDREIIEIPAGHNLRTSDDAIRTFKLILGRTVERLLDRPWEPVDPERSEMLALIEAERERLEQRSAPAPERYWHDYLIGRGEPGSGYDFYRNLAAFRSFLQREVFLLDVRDGMTVADMGCGTGLFLEQLTRLHAQDGAREVSVTAVDLVPEALASARAKAESVLPPPVDWTFGYRQVDLEPNRLLPVREFLDRREMALSELHGRIEGLTAGVCRELASHGAPGESDASAEYQSVGAALRLISSGDSPPVSTAGLSPAAALVVGDLDQAVRCARGFKTPAECRFSVLNFSNADRALQYPFLDSTFDRLVASLFISYLFDPRAALSDFFRVIRPGGRLVISSMRPDSDISTIFTDYVSEVQHGFQESSSLRDAREMLNEAAGLFELEEEGFFRFYDEHELAELVSSVGFAVTHAERAMGDPSQAVIVCAEKPL
ncbi:MAG: methyltransferase domain-containing protein [Spirochaetaceae bacterium]|nr:MAG: methyltransferase domain-containing protein [Spirochaetaceae bacterium]